MTTQPVGRLVCEFAVPSMVCMLVSAFYNIVDTYFVGRIDTQSTAALGIVFSYMAIIQAVSFFFGHGSGNFISRALGAQKSEQAETMASTGFYTAIALTTLIAVFGFLLMEPVLTLFGSTPTIMPRAKEYFVWILVGTPFISGVFVMNNQMRLQGNASMSMIGVMIGAALNIALDPLFIFTLDMGIAGA
ncbi:MAG: MATE family efflux transporter, partial [Salinivirgaceae bacterium]|nr:MATE family efflux transporter [Salinivirgaceae bacterium]